MRADFQTSFTRHLPRLQKTQTAVELPSWDLQKEAPSSIGVWVAKYITRRSVPSPFKSSVGCYLIATCRGDSSLQQWQLQNGIK
jgi:hypothetical protein